MAFLLDTNVCVDYLTGRYPKVVGRIQDSSPEDLYLSVVVVAELRYGADHSARRRTNHARIDVLIEEVEPLDFDLRAAATYGRVRSQLEASGTPIGPNDMLIAAHALSRGLTVVTDNTEEFGRVKGLKVENWRE
ncbi:MAG TPA: type II toxin-antitoxin system VapC family toxin [Vicinamibacteria bacterium]|nr:type II toxin-antitoxin system VapC family toxin [Vicinamibacteria bacterium]